jgi:hypothetical protein
MPQQDLGVGSGSLKEAMNFSKSCQIQLLLFKNCAQLFLRSPNNPLHGQQHQCRINIPLIAPASSAALILV